MDLRPNTYRVDSPVGSDRFYLHKGSWNESQRGQIAKQVRIVITDALHNTLLAREDRRERLTACNDDPTRLIWNGIPMRVLGRVPQQRIHPIHKRLRDRMLDPFRLRIDLVQGKAHDLDEKEFQQTMTAHEIS